MVSSRTPGVNNVTPANNAANNEADEVSSSPDGVDAGVGLGEDESRVNGGPENGSDDGVRRGNGDGDGDSGRDGGGDDGGTANVGWSQSGPPSLSMSVDLHNLVTSTNHQDSGRYSVSPDHAGGATPAAAVVKIGCYDEEESYEGFGSVEGDADDGPDSPGGSSSAPSPTGTSSRSSGRKRLSSNALASQLYRSGSFNSSGMGSNYDPADDVYSDVSLEDVMDLSHKGSSGVSSMCASRSRQSYTGASRSNHDRNPQDNPYYPYYPAGYPRWPPYDPCAAYHYHSGAFYPTASPYCTHHEVVKGETASWWSWFAILLLVFLVTGIWVGIVCYRKLSNDTRRKIAVWLARFPLQTAVTRTATRDTTQNCRPAKFLECASANNVGVRNEQQKSENYGLSHDVSDELPPSSFPSLANMETETFVNTVYADDDEDKDDESAESNDDAMRRDIEYQPMKKLDIAVGTGICVSKYDRRDA